MRLTFSKRAGKFDDLLLERNDGTTENIQCPKQGIIPHDMVHYAVERVISRKGFLSKLANGDVTQSFLPSEVDAEAIERLVETIQAELWSGRSPPNEIIELYQHSCAARSHHFFSVSEDDIWLIRGEVDALTAAWDAVPVGGSLVLSLETAF